YQIQSKIEAENPILANDNFNQSFYAYNTMELPNDMDILSANLPLYKKIPSGIRMQLLELHNLIINMIVMGDAKLNKMQIINGFKIWIMANKIILTKLNRGGSQTNKIMLSKIANIKQGRLLHEWKQFLVKCELNKNNNDSNKDTVLEDVEIERQNVKKMIRLVQQGNVYKGYNQLKSKGIAPLNNSNINIFKSKFIQGPENILRKEFQSELQCTVEIVNLIINQLDTTSAAGIDAFSPL